MTDTQLHRRDVIGLAVGAGAISTAFALTGRAAHADSHAATPRRGTIAVYRLGPVTLHSYVAPEASAMVTTHIVETATGLQIVDAQFLQAFAAEARAYADSLGKPIERLYLSHAHPDHILGGAEFADIPFVTSDGVLADVEGSRGLYAKRKEKLGDTTALHLPEGGLSLGINTWDGVEVVIAEVTEAEAAHTLTFHIPEAGLLIAQDLLYANAHAFPLGNTANWTAALQAIRATDGLRVLGAGHGLPATPGAVDDAISYLAFQDQAIAASTDADSAIATIAEAYPGYGGKDLLSFINFRFP